MRYYFKKPPAAPPTQFSLELSIFSLTATFSLDWGPVVPVVKVTLPGWPSGPNGALTLPALPWLEPQNVGLLPVGVIEVPFLIHALTPALGRAGQGEVPGWKLKHTVSTASTPCVLRAGIIQVRHLQLPIH